MNVMNEKYKDYKPRTGDIKFDRGKGFFSKLVRLLTAIRYGPSKNKVHSHVESFYDHDIIVSADMKGVVKKLYIPNEKNKEYRIYRLKAMNTGKMLNHQRIADKYVGKGYAYARYAVDALVLLSFFLFLFFVAFFSISFLTSANSVKSTSGYIAVFLGILYLLIQRLQPVLRKFDLATYDCIELQSSIYTENKLWVNLLGDSRNEFPDSMKQGFDILTLYGQAEIVFETAGYSDSDKLKNNTLKLLKKPKNMLYNMYGKRKKRK